MFKVEVMTRVRSILDPASLVHIPKAYHFDASYSVIIMEDCGPDVVTLEDFLCSGDAAAPRSGRIYWDSSWRVYFALA